MYLTIKKLKFFVPNLKGVVTVVNRLALAGLGCRADSPRQRFVLGATSFTQIHGKRLWEGLERLVRFIGVLFITEGGEGEFLLCL